MPGLLDEAELHRLREVSSPESDPLFVTLMTVHHAGAVKMADEELRDGSDPRLRITAHAIRHEQQGQIALMDCVKGRSAVALAIRDMFADNVNKSGRTPPDQKTCQS